MNNKQLMKEVVESKKNKNANKKPYYATRKLSIGLVSCMLGFISLVCLPQGQKISYADEQVNTKIEEKKEEKEENPIQEIDADSQNNTGGGYS